jgi:hypothetical protein
VWKNITSLRLRPGDRFRINCGCVLELKEEQPAKRCFVNPVTRRMNTDHITRYVSTIITECSGPYCEMRAHYHPDVKNWRAEVFSGALAERVVDEFLTLLRRSFGREQHGNHAR